MQAVCSEEVDKVCWSQVEVDVLEAEKSGEQEAALEQSMLLCENNREEQ